MNPRVVIILVNYNGYKDTVDCIENLKGIDYDNYKIIVIDNGSTCKEEDKITYIKQNCDYIFLHDNLGFSGGNNVGIRMAREKYKPDYYLLLNNDTVAEPDFLFRLVDCARSNDDVGVVSGKIYYYDNPRKIWFVGGTFDIDYGCADHIDYNMDEYEGRHIYRQIEFATGCMLFVPQQTFDRVGLLDETYFLYAEDADFSRRVSDAGLRLLYTDDAVIYHKVGQSSRNSDDVSYYMVRNNLYLIKKYARKKRVAYCKKVLSIIKAVICHEIRLSVAFEGVVDFAHNRIGKRGR